MPLLTDFLHLFAPNTCLMCGRRVAHLPLCCRCLDIPSVHRGQCFRCASLSPDLDENDICGLCLRLPLSVRRMHYLWNYDSAAKEIIRIAKYTPSNAILTLLADRLGSHLCSREAKRDWDLVIPVPSSTQSLWKRGFNQCEILSKNIARRLNLPHETRALSHLGARSPQAALGGKARIRNASHAFQAHSPYIAGKSILLIEDVVTTGATVAAITRQLLDAGAVFVDVAALARVSSWNTFRHEIAARI